MPVRSIPVLILFFISFGMKAGFNYDAKAGLIMERILELRFKEAQDLIQIEKKKDPANKLPLLYENYIDFLTNSIAEERTFFYQSQKKKRDRINKLKEDTGKSSPWYLHCEAEIELQWAFSRLKFGEQVSAAKEINTAYKLLQENLKANPGFLPSLKSMGLLQCLIALAVSDRHHPG